MVAVEPLISKKPAEAIADRGSSPEINIAIVDDQPATSVGGIASILNVQGASIHDDPAFGGLADPVCRATICGQAGAALDGQFMNRAALAYDEAVGDFARLGDVDIAAADIEPGEATQSGFTTTPPVCTVLPRETVSVAIPVLGLCRR